MTGIHLKIRRKLHPKVFKYALSKVAVKIGIDLCKLVILQAEKNKGTKII